ncbi:hypothetical protein DRO64_08435 [Candidatus Bathyarchaeota archaeon]|nr:MAG: hypothetical protein DRO64_08435 [Candidatus Bathyarchaeota archaeon]
MVNEWELATESKYDRQRSIWNQEILRKARVLVVGAGTLGNEAVKNLALLGVGSITIIDNDIIERVNLNRCLLFREEDIGLPKARVAAQRARELNPDIDVSYHIADIIFDFGAGFFENFDIVLSCLDNREARMYLNRYCYLVGRPLVDGALEGLSGEVKVVIPPITSCLECAFDDLSYKLIAEKYSCSGAKFTQAKEVIPMVIHTSAIIAGIQVQEAVKILHEDFSNGGKAIRYDGKKCEMLKYEIPIRSDCPNHEKYPIKEINGITKDSKIINVIKILNQRYGGGEFTLYYDKEICFSLKCPRCSYEKEVGKPLKRMHVDELYCPKCGSEMIPDSSIELKFKELTFRELGIPENSLIKVCSKNNNRKPFYIKV